VILLVVLLIVNAIRCKGQHLYEGVESKCDGLDWLALQLLIKSRG
jgi:hypothetical protein